MSSTSLSATLSKTASPSKKTLGFGEKLYEKAIGQHLYKSASAHPNPTRYGDFEVKGRVSDF
jgi:hypothetical protein